MKSTLLSAVIIASLLAACSREPAASTLSPAPAAESAPAVATKTPVVAPLSADQQARLIRPHSPVLGPANAPVTVVEFLDPACEACAAFAPVVRNVQFLYPDEVRVVVRFAAFHQGSADAVRLLVAAREQRKFEPVLEALFEHQQDWASHHAPDVEAAWQIAGKAGLDIARARRTAGSPAADAVVKQDGEDLVVIKVERTPTFFVNGKALPKFGPNELLALVKEEVARSKPPASP